MIKILHLASDNKFIDMALPVFNEFSNVKNQVKVYSKNNKLKYVQSPVDILTKLSEVTSLVKLSNEYDLILMHSFIPVWANFIKRINKNIPVVWIGWGYDYYDLINEKLYLEKTSIINMQSKCSENKFKNFLRGLWYFYLYGSKNNIIERIDYFSPVLEVEYNLVKSKLKLNNFPKYIPFNYGNLEDYFAKGLYGKRVSSNNILVGNSATSTCNHIESFDLIKNLRGVNGTIICPLSYGDKEYGEYIQEKGRIYFNEKFEALTTYMALDEYINKLSSCSYVIMNHCRQQAYGNIISMMYLGAKIFLREENPLYVFLKKRGAIIFSIQELESKKDLGKILSNSNIDKNREVLQDLFSRDIIKNYVSNIIKIVEKNES